MEVCQGERKGGGEGTKKYKRLKKYVISTSELERVLTALREMENAGLTPDAHALNGLLYALTAHDKLDAVHAIIETRLQEWPEARRDEPFGILARYYLRIGQVDKAEAMVQEVEKRGIVIGVGIANPLLGFYAEQVYVKNHGAGRDVTAQEAERMWTESQKLVDKIKATRGSEDTSTYYYRMKLLITFAGPAQWSALLEEVENSRVRVELRLYNLAAHAFTERGDIQQVAGLIARINNAGEAPDQNTYSTLVKACLFTHDLPALQSLAETALKLGVNSCFRFLLPFPLPSPPSVLLPFLCS